MEQAYLVDGDACYALARYALAGIQNSRAFAAMLRDGGWIDQHVDFLTKPLWRDCHTVPHSLTFTYLSRAFILSEVDWTLLLHTILPVEFWREMAFLSEKESSLSEKGASLKEKASLNEKTSSLNEETTSQHESKKSPQLEPPTHSSLHTTSRARVWRSAWSLITIILPGDEYAALELLLHVLLDPVSVKCYCEHHKEDAPLNVDLDAITECLVQQIGEGRLVEHSQALFFCNYAERTTLHLLPYRVKPSLPLLAHWFLMPLLLLRFEGKQSPLTVHTERLAVQFLTFLYELETSACCPFAEAEKPMRLYGLLHVVFGGEEVVYSKEVESLFWKLMPLYAVKDEKSGCRAHQDGIAQLGQVVPTKEVLGFLEKSCNCIVEEYYVCPFVFRVLLLFTYPCREWSYRVLLFNFFLDEDYAHVVLQSASEVEWSGGLRALTTCDNVQERVDVLYAEYVRRYQCVWEEKEEMISMYLRYLEQATRHLSGLHPEFVINPFSFAIRHYAEKERPRYLYFKREYEKACSMALKKSCVCYCKSVVRIGDSL